MKANSGKHHLSFNSNNGTYPIKVGNKTITNNKCENLLGIKIDKIEF